jgi:hypothetical protein
MTETKGQSSSTKAKTGSASRHSSATGPIPDDHFENEVEARPPPLDEAGLAAFDAETEKLRKAMGK